MSASLSCRICASPLKQLFADLGASPLSNAYLRAEQLDVMEPHYPLRVRVCEECFLVQLPELQSAHHIFAEEYLYFSSYSESWLRHCQDYVERMIARFQLGPQSLVVEAASNDGYLLQYFVAKGVPVLGVEPAGNVAKIATERGVPTIVRFFGRETARQIVAEKGRARLFAANNVLAHVPDLRDFVAGIAEVLHAEGVATLEFPHLMKLVDENQFDTIYHEHFSYFSLLTVQRAFADAGLVVFDVDEVPTHGGSLRVYARKAANEALPVTDAVRALVDREERAGYRSLDAYLGFQRRVDDVKCGLLRFVIDCRANGKKVVGYGAPAKGNTLLNYSGVRSDLLPFTVDRSPHKQGRFLPGSRIPVHAPAKIDEVRPDYVLILPWNLKDEITTQLAHIRSWGGQFVVAVPELRVLP